MSAEPGPLEHYTLQQITDELKRRFEAYALVTTGGANHAFLRCYGNKYAILGLLHSGARDVSDQISAGTYIQEDET